MQLKNECKHNALDVPFRFFFSLPVELSSYASHHFVLPLLPVRKFLKLRNRSHVSSRYTLDIHIKLFTASLVHCSGSPMTSILLHENAKHASVYLYKGTCDIFDVSNVQRTIFCSLQVLNKLLYELLPPPHFFDIFNVFLVSKTEEFLSIFDRPGRKHHR